LPHCLTLQNQKQDEHNILLQHFANQSDSIKLKQKIWESELAMKEKMFLNDDKKKKMDRHYETMKKHLALETWCKKGGYTQIISFISA